MKIPWLLLLLVLNACAGPAGVTPPAPESASWVAGPLGIAGTVVDGQGEPARGAVVYAYRSARAGLRGPADFAAPVDEQGRYFLDLVEGRYHLVARRRASGEDAGPPRPGDAWAPHPRNPLEVRPGFTTQADFRLLAITQPMIMKQGTLTSGDTGFSGVVRDAQGRPVSGALVLAYRDRNFQRMPDHTAPATGEDGFFTLYLPEAGSYCLVVRTRTRGQPTAGELHAVLGEGAQACPEARRGEIRDLGPIVVRPYGR
ncbi:carboxypeptidase-like regulatory domain-containing protein [Geoalkalibacter sp.]|uniref:carboxypeptidase-like regulatory domain-containing protein n=1 Tax=Geoalkalibacter sp. TaxID=3041440 RepID=UPI00272E5DAB|nr:carboxypeptidase-like regulatory domain-containing protein [Geoalkalibacter sp.]